MKFLVAGCGSIGKRHIKNLRSLGDFEIMAFDIDAGHLEEVRSGYRVVPFNDFQKALDKRPDAVLICTPNSLHISYATDAAKAGCHLFVEKPLSHNLSGVDDLTKIIKANNLKFLMGSNWKFHPSFKLMKKLIEEGTIGKILSFSLTFGQYLPDWHPQEDYRRGYSANKSLGGGVLLDSHEFDYLQWFLGPVKNIVCVSGKYSDLQIDTEDIALSIIETENGALGSVHLDYIQHPYARRYYFYGENGTIEWDYRKKTVSVYKYQNKEWKYFQEEEDYDLNQMYIEELKHFVAVLDGREVSVTNIYNAVDVLNTIIWAKAQTMKEFE